VQLNTACDCCSSDPPRLCFIVPPARMPKELCKGCGTAYARCIACRDVRTIGESGRGSSCLSSRLVHFLQEEDFITACILSFVWWSVALCRSFFFFFPTSLPPTETWEIKVHACVSVCWFWRAGVIENNEQSYVRTQKACTHTLAIYCLAPRLGPRLDAEKISTR
jgi:hypothetical protein